jgi:hypothetical protein
MSNQAVRPPRSHLANVVDAMPDATPSLERPTGFVPRRSAFTAVADAPSRYLRTVTCRGGSTAAGWLCRIVEQSHVPVPDRAAPTPCCSRYARCARQPRRRRDPAPAAAAHGFYLFEEFYQPSSEVALFFICTERRGHAGKQNQAPKQALGVVTLHAVCEE